MTTPSGPSIQPTAVTLKLPENVVEIGWSDGHTSTFGGAYLRFICPCADCRGHAPGEKPPPGWSMCADVRVTHVEPVGTYALRFTLSDGHATGIYGYDTLRRNCPSENDAVDDVGRPVDP